MIFPNSENYNKMGRQINFFMMSEDITELDEKLKKDGFMIIAEENEISGPQIIESLLDDKFGKRKYLIFEEHLGLLHFIYSEKKNKYRVNETLSPVIEFYAPFYSSEENTMRPGRIYYNYFYYNDSGEKTLKPDKFIKSTESLFKWFKRKFKNQRPKETLTTTKAMKWKVEVNGVFNEL